MRTTAAGRSASPPPLDHLGRLLDGLEGRQISGAFADETRALRARGRLVVLARDPRQAAERFAALVDAAILEFNRGGITRAGRVFDLVDRLLASGRLDAALVEPLRQNGHRQLDLERLRHRLQCRQRLPLGMLRLFRVFTPERLLDRLGREARRERRELLLSLLEAHGAAARTIARRRLLHARPHEDDPSVLVGLVQLLRRLPAPPEDARGFEAELSAVARLLIPGGPPPLLGEALAYLGRQAHPRAARSLVLFLRELEGVLLESVAWGSRGDQLITALDRVAVALARHGSSVCWAALVEHGLRSEPALGDSAARLAPLGVLDLGATPELASRLIDAINDALPPGLLTPLPASQSPRVLRILAGLRATRMPEVRELLQFLAARFPLQQVGLRAAVALEAFDAQPTPPASSASLSGDLSVFGLPALLQNLADGGVTGVLTLGDAARPAAATFVFDKGRLRGMRVGATVGAAVVYQLLQRPFADRFSFLHRQGVVTWTGEPARALGVPELILEGLRRCDELAQLASRVPDDAAFQASGRPPTVASEWDIDLVTRLWERAADGDSARACEEALGADAWQVRRCLAHWLEDASLLPRPRAKGANPPRERAA